MTAIVLRGDAAHLPLPDESTDLVVTSVPYWGLRSYTDGGEHYDGQIGSEETPAEWLEALWRCTAEWMRVLKPGGSIFVNCGDKYAAGHGGRSTEGDGDNIRVRRTRTAAQHWTGSGSHPSKSTAVIVPGFRPKTLMLLPERYRLGCVDRLGLIVREVIEWHKPNPIPESVRDRCWRTHEDVVHLVKQPRYFAAIDEIREPHTGNAHSSGNGASRHWATSNSGRNHRASDTDPAEYNPLGKVPGSVWTIQSQSLIVPDWLDVDHFAAFPMELPRRIILGWSPRGGLVIDPFGGTGTTVLVADALGRTGITLDRSWDYCRLARWRTTDPAERARAMGVPKPPPVPDGQDSLFDLEAS